MNQKVPYNILQLPNLVAVLKKTHLEKQQKNKKGRSNLGDKSTEMFLKGAKVIVMQEKTLKAHILIYFIICK